MSASFVDLTNLTVTVNLACLQIIPVNNIPEASTVNENSRANSLVDRERERRRRRSAQLYSYTNLRGLSYLLPVAVL
jgi:hypothetical protein